MPRKQRGLTSRRREGEGVGGERGRVCSWVFLEAGWEEADENMFLKVANRREPTEPQG